MIKRTLEKKLRASARKYPVVFLSGPRQSGKTTLCRATFPKKAYVSFENPQVREFAENDPKGLLAQYPKGAIFDEIQRSPHLLSYIQGIVDESGKSGKYILTGSQNMLLLKSVQQSLAGRVSILKLLPFSLREVKGLTGNFSLDKAIYTGGFPRIFDKKLNPTEAMRNYAESYIERDVRQIIDLKSLSLFQKFLKLCAGRVGQVLNLSSIANDTGVSHTTIREWLSVLESSFVVYLLPAYYRNFNKRIIKSPKLYFFDTGLACYLLGIENKNHLARDPLRGHLFENLVLTEILKHFWAQGLNAPLYFFRDNIGNEVDLIKEKMRKIIGLEIKAGQTVNSEWFKGLDYLKKISKNNMLSKILIYGGQEVQKRSSCYVIGWRDIPLIFSKKH